MAKRSGYPGGMMPGNMGNLMKQAQRMQAQMQEQQAELEKTTFEGTAGGGAVKVSMTGLKVLTAVSIDKEVVDPDDVEMLQDLIIAATNEAMKKVDEVNEKAMSKYTGGMGGLF